MPERRVGDAVHAVLVHQRLYRAGAAALTENALAAAGHPNHAPAGVAGAGHSIPTADVLPEHAAACPVVSNPVHPVGDERDQRGGSTALPVDALAGRAQAEYTGAAADTAYAWSARAGSRKAYSRSGSVAVQRRIVIAGIVEGRSLGLDVDRAEDDVVAVGSGSTSRPGKCLGSEDRRQGAGSAGDQLPPGAPHHRTGSCLAIHGSSKACLWASLRIRCRRRIGNAA